MRNLRLNPNSSRDRAQVSSERGVVLEEMGKRGKSPDSAMFARMYETAFDVHPYRWMTIGRRPDVESMTIEQLRAFYDTYYWPNNCTVVIRGDFNSLDALALIAKHYGKIPASPQAVPVVWEIEPPQQGERRFEVRKSGDLERVWLGFHVPEAGHDDTYALAVIARLLGGNSDPSSRFYMSLVERGLVADATCTQLMQRNPGLFIVDSTVAPGVAHETVEQALLRELERLTTEPVGEDELDLARQANRTSTMQGTQDPMAWVKWVCEGEAAVDWRWQVQFDDRFDVVTSADIMRVAIKYFGMQNRTVGVFFPTRDEAESQ